MRGNTRIPTWLGMVSLGMALALAMPASAETKHSVALGKVTSRVERTHVDVGQLFRKTVSSELARLELRANKPYELRASLVRMETERSGRKAETQCLVSATLHEPGGAIRALLRGRAQVQSERATAAERRAMRRAVRGALHRLQDAITTQ